jgi:predicted outer membrane protein
MRVPTNGIQMAALGLAVALSTIVCDDDDGDDNANVDVDRDAGAGGSGGISGGGGSGNVTNTGGSGGVPGAGGTGGTAGSSGGVGGASGDAGGAADAGATGDATTAESTAPLTTEAQVLGVMAEANGGEVTLGILARSRAQTAAVLDFANMMVDEHSAAASRVVSLAARMGVLPADSAVRTQLETQTMATRTNLSGIQDVLAFERTYIDSQVTMHAMVLNLIDQQLMPLAQNPELITELTAMRTAVSTHLSEARALQTSTTADGGAPDVP